MKTRMNAGMTLLETMVAVSIFTVIMGVIFTMSLGIGNVSRLQESQVRTSESGRNALMRVASEIRQAQRLDISNNNVLPAATLKYRLAQDVDGNGTAVNRNGTIELSAQRTIKADTDDLNRDGITSKQLIIAQGTTVLAVLCNNLCPLTETNADTNGNGRLDRGFYVFSSGGTLSISIQTQETLANGRTVDNVYFVIVRPRN